MFTRPFAGLFSSLLAMASAFTLKGPKSGPKTFPPTQPYQPHRGRSRLVLKRVKWDSGLTKSRMAPAMRVAMDYFKDHPLPGPKTTKPHPHERRAMRKAMTATQVAPVPMEMAGAGAN